MTGGRYLQTVSVGVADDVGRAIHAGDLFCEIENGLHRLFDVPGVSQQSQKEGALQQGIDLGGKGNNLRGSDLQREVDRTMRNILVFEQVHRVHGNCLTFTNVTLSKNRASVILYYKIKTEIKTYR
jgi:hypothetical protein